MPIANQSKAPPKRKDPQPDIVVAIPHLRLVKKYLADAGVLINTTDVFEPLGLARVELCNTDAAATKLYRYMERMDDRRVLDRFETYRGRRAARLGRNTGLADRRPDRGETRPHIETVLAGLRALSSVEYDGWLPTVGKNRLVGWVVGGGEVSHGGASTGEGSHGQPPTGVRRADVADPRQVGLWQRTPNWKLGHGQGARVGVLDTGLWANPWLHGRWVARQSDRLPVQDARKMVLPAAAGHATFVTGLVLSQAPCATVEVRKALDENGFADSWTVARKIVEFGRSGLDVLNLSFMCYSEDSEPPMAMAAAIDRLDPDLVVVASAGNHASRATKLRHAGTQLGRTRHPAWPAALDDVVAVGACDRNGRLASFSPDAPWVDLCAPGVDLVSSYLPAARVGASRKARTATYRRELAIWSGTSFSAALVSGAIAASIVPGRISAKAALEDLMGTARAKGRSVGQSDIPYLALNTEG